MSTSGRKKLSNLKPKLFIMKPKKNLKFSKETVIVLDQNAKKTVKGGAVISVDCLPSFACKVSEFKCPASYKLC